MDELLKQFDALLQLSQSLEESGCFDDQVAIQRRRLAWKHRPERIVLLRHGQSEGNVDKMLYTSKGDSRLELTREGICQAKEAGSRLKQTALKSRNIIVCTSPFERAMQTLLGLYEGGFPRDRVRIHIDPQIREQEFGNFQPPGLTGMVRAEEDLVGRTYYRRPNAESSADVFDRVKQFWDKLFGENGNGLLAGDSRTYDMCLVVTHGLTIRLMLMCLFNWSVATFESVWNLSYCEHVTLKKNSEQCRYEFCTEESFPARLPWATRKVWVVLKNTPAPKRMIWKLEKIREARRILGGALDAGDPDEHEGHEEFDADAKDDAMLDRFDKFLDAQQNKILRARSLPFTVINYLEIPQPRTMHIESVLSRLVPGHNHSDSGTVPLKRAKLEELAAKGPALTKEQVEFIDWWGSKLSYEGKMLRCNRSGTIHPDDDPRRGASKL
eukprot:s2464_g4.t1